MGLNTEPSLLTETQVSFFLMEHTGWTVVDDSLHREFAFDSFAKAMGFVASVGVAAEQVGHHPEIWVRFTSVTILITTHDTGGLTSRDTHLAALIDDLL